MSNIAAIFDIDGTVFRDSLLLQHLEKCVDYDVFPQNAKDEIKDVKKQWKNRELDYDDYMYTAVDTYTKYIQGKSVEDIDFVARKVIEKQYQLVYKYTRNKILEHQERGHKVIFISGSPSFLVEKMAEKFGVTTWFASDYETIDNKYTGNVKPMWDSKSKKKTLQLIEDVLDINLKKSYAYGDTTGDYTMLSNVGFPTAINPNKKLFKKLRDNKIDCKIIVERKDMIYRIDLMDKKSSFILNQ